MTAQYPNLTLTFGPAQSSLLYRLRTGLPKKDATVEPLYVELQDGRTFLLSELPLDVIKPLCADAYSTKKAIGEVLVYQDVLDSWGSSRGQFIFHNDQLVEVNLVTSPGAIVQKIALSEDGPYVPLAMSREQMEEMFGKPDKWQEYRYQRGP